MFLLLSTERISLAPAVPRTVPDNRLISSGVAEIVVVDGVSKGIIVPSEFAKLIIQGLDQTIDQAKAENKSIDQVGVRFMKFCAKYDLNRISEQAQLYVEPFNAKLNA